jgi:hypothetical protein
VGVTGIQKVGAQIKQGESLLTIHYNDESKLGAAIELFREAYRWLRSGRTRRTSLSSASRNFAGGFGDSFVGSVPKVSASCLSTSGLIWVHSALLLVMGV